MATSGNIRLFSDAKYLVGSEASFDYESVSGSQGCDQKIEVEPSSYGLERHVGGCVSGEIPGGVSDVFEMSELMRSLSGMEPGELQAVKAFFEWQTEKCKVQAMQLAAVLEGASASVDSQGSTATSRVSRRSMRRNQYLDECRAAAEVDGFCYLLLVKLPSRLGVRERIGPRPGLEKFLTLGADELDLSVLADLTFVNVGGGAYHLEKRSSGNALAVLRRTLFHFPAYGASMRSVLGQENTDGLFLSLRAVVGAMSAVVEDDVRALRSVLDRGAAVVYHSADWDLSGDRLDVVEGHVECPAVRFNPDGFLSYRFGPLSQDGMAIIPAGHYVESDSVRVGSDVDETCVVFRARASLSVVRDSGVSKSVVQETLGPGVAYSSALDDLFLDRSPVRVRVVDLEGPAASLWRNSDGYLDNKSTNARFAARNSSFYIHRLPHCDGGRSVKDVDVVSVTDPLDSWAPVDDLRCTVQLTGKHYSAVFDGVVDAVGVCVVQKLRFEAARRHCVIAGVATILSDEGSVALNADHAYLQVDVAPLEGDSGGSMSFHVMSVRDSYCFDEGGPSGDEFSDAY